MTFQMMVNLKKKFGESCVFCLCFVIVNITVQRSKWLIFFFPMFNIGKVVYFIREMSNKWVV